MDDVVEFFSRSSWGTMIAQQHPWVAVAGGLVLVGVLGRASWVRARST